MENRPSERVEVLYRGRVQGVGFRATTRHLAAGFRVTGYVKNLPDGQVRVVAEGTHDEIERFLAEVEEELDRYIAATERQTGPATDEFDGFQIR